MYYAALPPGLPPGHPAGTDKPAVGNPHPAMYIQAPFPGTPTAAFPAAGPAHPQPTLPPGMRYAPQPAFAMVSQPAAYNTISQPAYHHPAFTSLPPTSSAAYIQAAQYPGMTYPAMTALASRSPSSPYQHHHQHHQQTLVAPGFAAPMPPPGAAIPGHSAVAAQPRHYQIATYPPGYPIPAGTTVPMPYAATAFGPPFQ